MNIVDFHTHAFPDSLAERAVKQLESECEEATAHIGGRVADLLSSMDRNGIARSIVLNIATKPSHYVPIVEWCTKIASDRIVPFPSVHPADQNAVGQISDIAVRGFKGIKLHPYYQSFVFDDESMMPLYEAMAKHNLILLTHAGFDIAYDRIRIVDPEKIVNVHRRFPDLTMVASHFGAWEDWDYVEQVLLGTDVYIDVSYSLQLLEPSRARALIAGHGIEKVLFGSDSPWEDQGAAIKMLKELSLDEKVEQQILYENADNLLGE